MSNEITVVENTTKTLMLEDTVSTRKYPFTRQTLDQIQDLRRKREDRIYDSHGEVVVVPAPIIIAEAVDALHRDEFGEQAE